MICSNCNTQNNQINKYCYNCGKILKKSSDNKDTSLVFGIICLIMSFFLGILCFIPGIVSIIYAKKYKKESGNYGVGFGLSLGGMIYSFIITLLALLLFLFIFSVTNERINNDYNYNEYIESVSKV